MVKYRKSFLDEIKSLLLYLVEFSEDEFILPKEYLNNYVVNDLDRRLITMIIYDESTFSANDSR